MEYKKKNVNNARVLFRNQSCSSIKIIVNIYPREKSDPVVTVKVVLEPESVTQG